MKNIVAVLAFIFASTPAFADTAIAGVSIGQNAAVLKTLKLPLIASDKSGETESFKYKTVEGNEVSVTVEHNKIVYIELDWTGDEQASKTPIKGLVFGKTSLSKIRKRFGSNGFAYKTNVFTKDGDALITFNCYRLSAKTPQVLVVVDKVLPGPGITESNIAEHFRLEAIIIADPSYLDSIWGDEKISDPAEKTVSL